MAALDKILRKSNFTAAMTALIAKLNSLFVRKESGKGLSTNDYTTAEKTKLAGIADGANKYVLPAASTTALGGVKAGTNVTIAEDGTISAIQGKVDLSPYAKTADMNTALDKKADKATTLAGYGITDAKIANGVITLGANSITPITQHQSLAAYAKSEDVEKTFAKKSDLTTVYKYRGSVDTYADLPTNGQAVGDVYNVVAADAAHGINAGDNVAWNGNTWDNLSGVVDLTAYIKAADADKKYMQINDFPLATDDEIVAIVNDTVK